MDLDFDTCYEALSARDSRFDGSFFVGVLSTGIYCRAVCPARTPLRKSCRFYRTSVEAERDQFRPCLRCRPEVAPRDISASQSVAHDLLRYLQRRAPEIDSLEGIAEATGYSSRQLRRLMMEAFGVTPIAVLQTERLLFAKKLLQETSLPVSQIALSAGFRSLRRFNALFQSRYRCSPSELRSRATPIISECITLKLAYRPPYAWAAVIDHFSKRAIPGVECVTSEGGGEYARVVAIEGHQGWLTVKHMPQECCLCVDIATSLSPVLYHIAGALRCLFDTDAHPLQIAAHFADDLHLGPMVEAQPGLRLIGAWDPFELTIRAVLGQQVSVAAARTLAGRLARVWGVPVKTPIAVLDRIFPAAETLAKAEIEELTTLGITRRRAETLRAVAQFAANGGLEVNPGCRGEEVIKRLRSIPGIGEWSAQYIAMRGFAMPDAFPSGDLGLRKAMGNGQPISERELNAFAENWRPWRAYAATYLWRSLSPSSS